MMVIGGGMAGGDHLAPFQRMMLLKSHFRLAIDSWLKKTAAV